MKTQSVNRARAKLVKQRHKARIKAKRPPHKRFLLHPATVFVLLGSGVLLFGWTLKTFAVDYTVNATIPAGFLTEPAVITSPTDGQRYKTKPIAVAGTCPYQSYINLYRNGVYSGTALCNPDGTFGLLSDLSLGANILQTHVFNVTNDEGPLSGAITVYYEPPAPTTVTAAKPSASTPAAAFALSGEYQYHGYKVGEEANLKVSISGGIGPYALHMAWGDGSESNYVQMGTKPVVATHTYSKAGSYSIKINGVDGSGATAFLQTTALITNDKHALIASPTNKPTSSSSIASRLHSWLWLLWPTYASLILMAISFWLGEREELYILQRRYNSHRLKHS
jgi:hypothetical protein